MDIDSIKKQAKALSRALQALSIANLDSATALETVARMRGYRNWNTAQRAGAVGRWNAAQVAVYAHWYDEKAACRGPGEDYSGCSKLLVAVMDVAGAQPLARAIKTIEYWAEVTQVLYDQAASELTQRPPLVPTSLALAFSRALCEALVSDADERVQHLQHVRDLLFEAALALRQLQEVRFDSVLILDSRDGYDYALAVGVPKEFGREAAVRAAHELLEQLQSRSESFSSSELLVRMAQRGFPPVKLEFGPVWDGCGE